jgi:NAD(P)-dependent dehydrogenase (short-subunit alcohol dehydrogenase family)
VLVNSATSSSDRPSPDRPSLDRSSLFSLDAKVALLTGASGFLGRTFAETLLENGADLIAIGRRAKLGKQQEIWTQKYRSRRVHCYFADMFDLEALAKTLDEIAQRHAVDILINNAHELAPASGFNTPAGSLDEGTMDVWMRNLTAGVCWPALTVQKIGAGMKERGHGSIVNISTMYALVAPRPSLYEGTSFLNPPAYSASKAAMIAFTRYVASFWGRHGIRANAILPGPFSNTEDAGPNSVQAGDPFIEKLKANTCLGRIGKARELAGALLFLASDASSYVTGQNIVVDGGWTAV